VAEWVNRLSSIANVKAQSAGVNTNKHNKMNKQPSTTKKIHAWLLRGYKLTPMQALEKWGCMRLAARIAELRKDGVDIRTTPITRNGKTFAEYKLS
jgi:hypothetical protein